MFDKGFFGNAFDFDGDGKRNSWEKAADMGAFIHMVEETEKEKKEKDKIE